MRFISCDSWRAFILMFLYSMLESHCPNFQRKISNGVWTDMSRRQIMRVFQLHYFRNKIINNKLCKRNEGGFQKPSKLPWRNHDILNGFLKVCTNFSVPQARLSRDGIHLFKFLSVTYLKLKIILRGRYGMQYQNVSKICVNSRSIPATKSFCVLVTHFRLGD